MALRLRNQRSDESSGEKEGAGGSPVERHAGLPRRPGRRTGKIVALSAAAVTSIALLPTTMAAATPLLSPSYSYLRTYSFGNAYQGCASPAGGGDSDAPIVGIALTTDNGGCWAVGADGGVFTTGDAGFFGSMGGTSLDAPIVGMAATSDGHGYWEVASDGGIFAFGDAQFQGSMGGQHLNEPIVGMAADPATGGYWEVASDGGVFSFDAPYLGSMGGSPLNEPVVGMAATPDGLGYWLVASDGGIFSFGDAGFLGSMGGTSLDAPVVGMAASADGGGYWLVGSDGGVFTFGDAPFWGSKASSGPLPNPIAAIAVDSDNRGYVLLPSDPAVEPGAPGRSGFDLARQEWIGFATLDCATQPQALVQAARYLHLGASVDGGNTSGYQTAINQLLSLVSVPGMTRTAAQEAMAAQDTAALEAFFGASSQGYCG